MTTYEKVRRRLYMPGTDAILITDEERSAMDSELEVFLNSIARCPNVESADDKLEELGQVQTILATICFKHKIELSDIQMKLVQQYDRWDLPEVRAAVFDAIKENRFL